MGLKIIKKVGLKILEKVGKELKKTIKNLIIFYVNSITTTNIVYLTYIFINFKIILRFHQDFEGESFWKIQIHDFFCSFRRFWKRLSLTILLYRIVALIC